MRPYDMVGSGEELEKNQKILLWLMEGQKEMVQQKRSPYGSVKSMMFMIARSFSPPLLGVVGLPWLFSGFFKKYFSLRKSTMCVFCAINVLGAPLGPRGLQPMRGPASARWRDQARCTRAGGPSCGTTCSRHIRFIQDPTMPPNPAPSPLIQLEEVCRRLEEEKIKSGTLQPKQR